MYNLLYLMRLLIIEIKRSKKMLSFDKQSVRKKLASKREGKKFLFFFIFYFHFPKRNPLTSVHVASVQKRENQNWWRKEMFKMCTNVNGIRNCIKCIKQLEYLTPTTLLYTYLLFAFNIYNMLYVMFDI